MANFTPLKSTGKLKRLMKYYYALTQAAPRLPMKTAWVTSGSPVEVPLSMGIIPQYPENYGALCGARKIAPELCQAAEARGYSPDLCSYARNDLGSLFAPDKAPLKGLAKPDLLIAGNNICGTVTKWWEHLAHYLDVPLFLFDTPFSERGTPPHLIDYAVRQVEDLIGFLERHTGRRFSDARFKAVAARSNETVQLWNDCLDMCTAHPSPLNAADRFMAMAPVVTMRGTRPALWFYRSLKEEVAQRVERGQGAIQGERRRLLWDNIAIWFDIFRFFNQFAEHGVSFPVDTYTSTWCGTVADDDPFRGVARVYSGIFLNRGMEVKLEIMARMMERYDLDGFVIHSNRSCKPYSVGQYLIKEELTKLTGKPGLVVEGDMVDSRHFDKPRVQSSVEAYLEMLQ